MDSAKLKSVQIKVPILISSMEIEVVVNDKAVNLINTLLETQLKTAVNG